MLHRDIQIMPPIPEGAYRIVKYKRATFAVYSGGRVWDINLGQWFATYVDKYGYLVGNKHSKAIKIHRLILMVWDRAPKKGCREQALHKNDVKTDNRIENLYWGTGIENWQDRKRNSNND